MEGTASAIALMIGTASLPLVNASRGALEASETDIVAARHDAHERLTVPVQIGGRGPYRFLLDTAAENTVISSALAAELALPASGRAKVIGVAGATSVDTVELDSILLGRRIAYGLVAPLLDRAHIGADGILGLDSLRSQRVLFDFRRNLIAIDEVETPVGNGIGEFEIVVRARRKSGQLIMTDAYVQGIRTAVVIDTGTDVSIGNRALQKALGRKFAGKLAVLDSVTGQQIAADLAVASELRVDKLAIRNVTVAFADAASFAALDLERRPAMLLGMRELRSFDRVAIDFPQRKILFDLSSGFQIR